MTSALFLQSPLLVKLGVMHGFSTRIGGVSEGGCASLNLASKWGDKPENVVENHSRLAQAAGFVGASLVTVHQVHGTMLAEIGPADRPSAFRDRVADALMSRARSCTLGIYTADCVPILIVDLQTGFAAAIHAGWRGTVAGILPKTIARFFDLGAHADNLFVALGPSIGPCCFEVGQEVAAFFLALDKGLVSRAVAGGKPRVNLQLANRLAALATGVAARQIDADMACTCCHPELFFSYRREGQKSGQQLSFIRPKGRLKQFPVRFGPKVTK